MNYENGMVHLDLSDVMALPEQQGFGLQERVIDGRTVRVPTQRAIGCFLVSDTTPMQWQEPDGTMWRLGKYLDGEFYKRRLR